MGESVRLSSGSAWHGGAGRAWQLRSGLRLLCGRMTELPLDLVVVAEIKRCDCFHEGELVHRSSSQRIVLHCHAMFSTFHLRRWTRRPWAGLALQSRWVQVFVVLSASSKQSQLTQTVVRVTKGSFPALHRAKSASSGASLVPSCCRPQADARPAAARLCAPLHHKHSGLRQQTVLLRFGNIK